MKQNRRLVTETISTIAFYITFLDRLRFITKLHIITKLHVLILISGQIQLEGEIVIRLYNVKHRQVNSCGHICHARDKRLKI